jgi:hypothetical protein
MLLEGAARAITGDIASVAATFTFVGGLMSYRTNIPIDTTQLSTHECACAPSNLPHFQSLRVNGTLVRVLSIGTLLVYCGGSVDDMRQSLLDAHDMINARDGDTNL